MTTKEKRERKCYVHHLKQRKILLSDTHTQYRQTHRHTFIQIFLYKMVNKHGSKVSGEHHLRRKIFLW